MSGSDGCGLSSGDDLSLRHLAPSKREEITSIEFLPDTLPVNKSTQDRVLRSSFSICGFQLGIFHIFSTKMWVFRPNVSFCRKPPKETLTRLHERKFILHSQVLNNLRKEISHIDDRDIVLTILAWKAPISLPTNWKLLKRVEFDIRSWCLKLRDYQTNYMKGVAQFRVENAREEFLSSTTPAGIDDQWDQFKRKILLNGATLDI